MLLPTHDFLGFQGQFLGSSGGSTPVLEYNIFGSEAPPASTEDPTAYTLGTRFKPSVNCEAIALRFYRVAEDTLTTTRTLHLWSNVGVSLGTATTTEVASVAGWIEAELASPIPLTAGTIYVVSYNKPSGAPARYAANNGYFAASAKVSGILTAVQDDAGDGRNGIYWDAENTFPVGTFGATCYFADIVVRA